MENNNTKRHDDPDCVNDSLGTAIRQLSWPFDTVQEKVDVINDKFANNFYISDKRLTLEEKKVYYKAYFKRYYEDQATFNFYGLTIEEPF